MLGNKSNGKAGATVPFDWTPATFEWNDNMYLSDWRIPVFSGIAYIICIFSLKLVMRNRKPMVLKTACAVHNGILAAFSLLVLVGQSYETFKASSEIGFGNIFCAAEGSTAKGGLYYWSYIFYLSKYYEFLDTVLLVLKKKPLDFLHCYHHAIVPTGCWLGWNGWYMPLITACIFNSAVHTVMYYYYCLATLGIRVWWKKYVTVFQIVQFCSGAGFTVAFYMLYFKNLRFVETPSSYSVSFTKGCSGSLHSVIWVAVINLSFLALFISFYTKTYKPPARKATKTE